VLLAGAGLLIASFAKLMAVNPGFDAQGVNIAEFPRTPEGFSPTQVWSFEQQALERIRRLPGVTAAAATSLVPLRGQLNFPMTVVGRPDASGSVQYRAVSSEYFEALRVPIERGRAFTATDEAAQAAPVVVINETFARLLLDNADPLGERIAIGTFRGEDRIPGFDDPEREIVGVVGDVRALGLGSSVEPTIYVPRAQLTGDAGRLGALIVRTETQLTLGPSVLEMLLAIDPRVPVPAFRAMHDVIGVSVAGPRFYAVLLGVFAGLALTLAALGIYGTVAFSVRQRTGEIAIRAAFGADARDVLGLVVRRGFVPVLIGLGIGLAAAFLLTRLLQGLLYGIDAADPVTLAAAAVTLLGVAIVAIWIPARRAARMDPLAVLRSE
jgi:putative ABC transport system permease protein